MNKTLALLVAVALAGWTGLALSLSGSWTTELCLLPTPALGEIALELTASLMRGWDVTSTSVFDRSGLTSQEFGLAGVLGPLTIEGWMEFAPGNVTLKSVSYVIPNSWSGLGFDLLIQDGHWVQVGPSYVGAGLSTTLELGGIELGLGVEHSVNHGITLDAADMIGEYLFYLDQPPYLIGADTWTLRPHPSLKPLVVSALNALYPKYFLTYKNIELVATKVTFRGTSTTGAPVTHVLTGTFEVYYFDAATGTVILTLGADTYLWYYIGEYGAANGWDLNALITYEVAVADVSALFLFPNYMTYTITASLDPVFVKIVFDDVSTGIQFKEATLSLTGLNLCCGVTYDVELALTKVHGFEYVEFSLKNFAPICCGISFDMTVKFGVDYKLVTITPKFAGFGEACFTVWGGPVWAASTWSGIWIDGYRIRCTIADCNYLEYVHAFAPTATTIPSAIRGKFLAVCAENEYLELGFCGAGCCGGKYEATLRFMMSTTPQGGLFGFTRLVGTAKIPVMANFTLNLEFITPIAACATPKFCLGWTFTF